MPEAANGLGGKATGNDTSVAPQILQDRVPSVGVRLVVLCPRMDLVALVLDGDTIAIQRLSWQRLATLPPPSPAQGASATERSNKTSALAWSPSGSSIVVTMTDGSVRILRIDPSGAATKPSRSTLAAGSSAPQTTIAHPATAVAWIEHPHFPPAPYIDRDVVPENTTPTMSDSLIAVGDATGCLTLFSFDLAFRVATVQVLSPQTSVTNILLPPGEINAVVSGRTKSEVSLCVLPLKPVSLAEAQLHRAGLESVAALAITSELRKASKALKDSWIRDGLGQVETSITEPLSKLIIDFAEDASEGPWQLLHNAFCGGGVSGALEQLLARKLGEGGAREALRAFSTAGREAQSALHSALPLAERMVFRASEYRGLASDAEQFSAIGVSLADADRVLDAAQNVLNTLMDLVMEVEDSDAEMQAFLKWVCSAATRVAGGNPETRAPLDPGDAANERELVTAFFESKLGHEAERDEVLRLYREFDEEALPRLVTEIENLLSLPTATVSEALRKGLEAFPHPSVSLPVDESAPGSVSTVVRKGASGPAFVEIAMAADGRHLLLARRELSFGCSNVSDVTSEPLTKSRCWSLARAEVCDESKQVTSLSHGVSDGSFVLTCVSGQVNNGKRIFSLRGVSLPDLSFGEFSYEMGRLPTPERAEGDFLIDFCTGESGASCALSVEPTRSVASVLVGTRRVVVFDLGGREGGDERLGAPEFLRTSAVT